jgi:hypothetical protein
LGEGLRADKFSVRLIKFTDLRACVAKLLFEFRNDLLLLFGLLSVCPKFVRDREA